MLTFNLETNEPFKIKFWPSIYSKTHTHTFWEILLLCEGSLTNILNQRQTEIHKYDVVLIHPSDTHKIVPNNNKHAEYYNIAINTQYFTNFCDFLYPNLSKELSEHNNLHKTLSAHRFEKCLNMIRLANACSTPAEKRKYFNILLSTLLVEFLPLNIKLPLSPVEESIELMSNPKNMKLSLKEISKMIGYTPEHLTRLFKKAGKPHPSAISNDFKMQHAKNLLLQTNMSIPDISYSIGISSLPHFYQAFKKYHNTTPLAVRKTRNKP